MSQFFADKNEKYPSLNSSKVHGLVACGGDDGAVECFDMRVRSSVGRTNAVAPACDTDQEVTAIEFDGEGGYFMAVGSSAGKAYYGARVAVPPYFNSAVASGHAPHPYMCGPPQHMMPPYGPPYAAIYAHGCLPRNHTAMKGLPPLPLMKFHYCWKEKEN